MKISRSHAFFFFFFFSYFTVEAAQSTVAGDIQTETYTHHCPSSASRNINGKRQTAKQNKKQNPFLGKKGKISNLARAPVNCVHTQKVIVLCVRKSIEPSRLLASNDGVFRCENETNT